MIGYLRPSSMREAMSYKKDIQEHYPRAKKERRGGARAESTSLTPDEVRWVRKNAKKNGGDMTYAQMAEERKVSKSNIRCIVCGITWKEIV